MSRQKEVKHVAIYLRISDEKKTQGKRVSAEETLQNHKDRLEAFCEINDYTFVLFQEVVSGGKTELNERPELERLLKRLNEFDAIVVTELSRLSRDSMISAIVKKEVIRYKKLIITPEYEYDLTDASDQLMYDLSNSIAVHERTIIGKRIRNNKQQLTKSGFNASGSVPLGYIRNAQTKKLEIDPATAHIISTSFYLVNRGYGANRIQQYLNEMGYKTKQGKAFTIRAVKDLLKKETYKGYTLYNDIDKEMVEDLKTGEAYEKRKINYTITVPDTHPAIITPEMFDKVQDIRAKRGERYAGSREKPNTKIPPSMLKDLVYCDCDKCRRKMRISYEPKSKEYLIRKCVDILPDGSNCPNSGFKAKTVESMVLKQIFSYQEKLEAEIKQIEENDHDHLVIEKQNLKSGLEKQLKELDKEGEQFANLQIQFALEGKSTAIMEKVIQEKIDKNEEARKSIQQKLQKINQELDQQPNIEIEKQKRQNVISIIEKIKKEDSPEKMNNLLKQFIFKVYYKRILPEELKNKGAKNFERRNFLPIIAIEYV